MRILKKPIQGLIGKIKETLKEPTAEELFPNFINYLKEEYGSLIIERIPEQTNRETWTISRKNKTMESILIGTIQSYVRGKAISAEHGYQAEVLTQGKRLKLEYRRGYLLLDTTLGAVVKSKDPQRYDNESIPFP